MTERAGRTSTREPVDGVLGATGRTRLEWFEGLDEWGARGRTSRETMAWLESERGLGRWWAQKLMIEYQQDRGLRSPGVRPDGTFEIGVSRTIAAPPAAVRAAFVDTGARARWLGEANLRERSRAADALGFDAADGSRITVRVEAGQRRGTLVTLGQARIGNADSAARWKSFWRERLGVLKELLEA